MWEFENYGDSIALIQDDGKTLTYRQLAMVQEQIGRLLPQRALVFSFCRNTIASVAGYTAFLQNRIVPVLLKSDLEVSLREELIRVYQPNYLYIPIDMQESFAGLRCVYEFEGYQLLERQTGQLPDMYKDLALLLTTSGSTGSPKLVRQSYRNIESNTDSIAAYLKLTAQERAITTLPMNYTYGLSIINTHLKVGARICLTERSILRGDFWTFFDQVQATSFGGVPYTYEILNKMRFTKRDLPSLHYMTQAGGKLSPQLHKVFAEYALSHGKQFIVMYGQTEATARMAYLPGEMALEKYGSTGIAIPGGTLRLIDTDGSYIVQPDQVGELVYEGDNVTLGYAQNREDLALGDERHGILQTGDMAYFDKDGYYFIVGRRKRFLKLFGNRVNLDETERMIRGAFPEVDAACGGVDDLMKIYVVSDDAQLKKNIHQFLTEKTGLSPLGFQTVSVSRIPRNEAGKIQYREIEDFLR